MARAPNEKVNEAYGLFCKGLKLIEIANKLNIPAGTVRRWKSTYKWDNERSNKNSERSKRKRGAQPGNKNSKGGPPKNKKAETHGFFTKYLPEDTLDIIQEIERKDPLDILWENISIQYAAIIRAQKIMHVTEKEEMIKELSRQTRGDTSDTDEYEFQFAWDRQATFLQAQSRAMKTLEGLIKQYDELLKSGLATEEQKARIEVLKSKVPNKDTANIQGQINALANLIQNPTEREPLEDE